MENAMNNGTMKASKVNTLNENVPLLIELDDMRGRYLQSTTMSPGFQPYAENVDVGSPLARYFYAGSPISNNSGEAFTSPIFGASKYMSKKMQHYCGSSSRSRLSLSPLSSIENLEMKPLRSPPIYGTPVKVDDEVFVMDDIQVRHSLSGGKNRRSSPSSSRRSSSSSSSSTKSVFKTDICRAWEESGNCRYNSKCQFAHGKEELHLNRVSTKSKYEMSKLSPRPGVSIHGPNSRTVLELPDVAELEHDVAELEHDVAELERAFRGLTISQPASPEPYCHAVSDAISDWSPLDDGIEAVLPNTSGRVLTREEIDAYIFGILNDPTTKKRLPVFVALCEGQ